MANARNFLQLPFKRNAHLFRSLLRLLIESMATLQTIHSLRISFRCLSKYLGTLCILITQQNRHWLRKSFC